MHVFLEIFIREGSVCPQAEPVAAADAAAEPEEDVQMEELEHEIEAAAAPEEPEEAEDELAGEMEEENTGKIPKTGLLANHFIKSRDSSSAHVYCWDSLIWAASGEQDPHRPAANSFSSWAWYLHALPVPQDKCWP